MKIYYLLLCLYHTTLWAQFPETLDLGQLNGSDGFVLNGVNSNDWTGWAAKSAGDFNGDGLTDLIVGSDGFDSTGQAYVLYGQDSGFPTSISASDLTGDIGFTVFSSTSDNLSIGWSVDGLGDVNNDGLDDIIVGDPHFIHEGNFRWGNAYVIFGRETELPDEVDVSSLNGANGFSLLALSGSAWSELARSVSSAGDLNNDGFMDIAVGSFVEDVGGLNSGSIYVLYGSELGFPAEVNLSALTAEMGFRVSGEFAGMGLGWHVSSLGDVNGDGIDDLGMGTRSAQLNENLGFAYILYGNSNGFPVNFNTSIIDGSNGFKVHGASTDRNQTVISAAGDFNGDGLADISIGSMMNGVVGGDVSTETAFQYVLHGHDNDFPSDVFVNNLDGITGFSIVSPDPALFKLTQSTGTAGDINSDGFDDFFVGTFTDTSAILGYVIFGGNNVNNPTFDLGNLNGQNGFRVMGTPYITDFTAFRPVAALNDINGDGLNDFAIGNQFAENNGVVTGAAYVVFGKPQDLIFENGFD